MGDISDPLIPSSPPLQGGGTAPSRGGVVGRRGTIPPVTLLSLVTPSHAGRRLPLPPKARLPDRGLPWVRGTLWRPQAFPAVASADFPIGRRLAMLPASR